MSTAKVFTDGAMSFIQVQDGKIYWTIVSTHSAHTLPFTYTGCLTAQITDNTVTLALFRAKPRLGSDDSHDLRPKMLITLLL